MVSVKFCCCFLVLFDLLLLSGQEATSIPRRILWHCFQRAGIPCHELWPRWKGKENKYVFLFVSGFLFDSFLIFITMDWMGWCRMWWLNEHPPFPWLRKRGKNVSIACLMLDVTSSHIGAICSASIIWARLASEAWCHYRSKHVIFQTSSVFQTANDMQRDVSHTQPYLAESNVAWICPGMTGPGVNAVFYVKPRLRPESFTAVNGLSIYVFMNETCFNQRNEALLNHKDHVLGQRTILQRILKWRCESNPVVVSLQQS